MLRTSASVLAHCASCVNNRLGFFTTVVVVVVVLVGLVVNDDDDEGDDDICLPFFKTDIFPDFEFDDSTAVDNDPPPPPLPLCVNCPVADAAATDIGRAASYSTHTGGSYADSDDVKRARRAFARVLCNAIAASRN